VEASNCDGVTAGETAPSFNLPAFEQAVAERSPLLPSQVSDLFGAVTADNKSLVWDFIRLPAKLQMMSWQAYRLFEGGRITRVR
jgi:hypothetical protein